MSDIELVIKIDANIANGIIYGHGDEPRNIVRSFQATIADAIKNGTPLNEVLDKIKSEIEQLTSRYSISKERGGMGQVEWSDRLIRESDVLQIIDKYRGEVDCRECKAEYECYECEKYKESEVKDAIC